MRRVAGNIAELGLEPMAPSPTTRGTCQHESYNNMINCYLIAIFTFNFKLNSFKIKMC